MFRKSIAIAALVAAGSATVAEARIVWKGRDGKAYESVKDCFTHNPQCLPERAFAVPPSGPGSAPGAIKHEVVAPRDAASGLATGRRAESPVAERPIVCLTTDRWAHAEPCDSAAGELRVQILD